MDENVIHMVIHEGTAKGTETLIHIKGDIRNEDAGELRLHLQPEGIGHLVLDLGDTGFISARAISYILEARFRLDSMGGSLEIVNPSPEAARELELLDISLK